MWEDVKDGFKNSYPLGHSEDLIDTPRECLIEGKEIDLKSRADKLNQTLQKSSQTDLMTACGTSYYHQSESPCSHELHLERHASPPEDYRTHEPVINPDRVSSRLYEGEVSQVNPTAHELCDGHDDEDYSQIQEPLQNLPEHLVSQESGPCAQEVHSSREEGKLQDDDMDQGKSSRPPLKRGQGGRVDNEGECYLWQYFMLDLHLTICRLFHHQHT